MKYWLRQMVSFCQGGTLELIFHLRRLVTYTNILAVENTTILAYPNLFGTKGFVVVVVVVVENTTILTSGLKPQCLCGHIIHALTSGLHQTT